MSARTAQHAYMRQYVTNGELGPSAAGARVNLLSSEARMLADDLKRAKQQ